jgi:hypothetical protein
VINIAKEKQTKRKGSKTLVTKLLFCMHYAVCTVLEMPSENPFQYQTIYEIVEQVA